MGWRLTLNPVYAYGTERTAKNAASYRLGSASPDVKQIGQEAAS
ncbi:hypothetical protein [Nonomuraea rhodomycinica]|nr:hypothetical protein [Nonomuraea rhodomycinica]